MRRTAGYGAIILAIVASPLIIAILVSVSVIMSGKSGDLWGVLVGASLVTIVTVVALFGLRARVDTKQHFPS